MAISNDRELARAVGLTDIALQDLLSKTRQAIHAGLSAGVYFKPNELKTIHMYVMQHARRELETFRDYVTRTRPQDAAEAILKMDGFFANPDIDSRTDRVVVVLPDYLYLKHENPEAADYLINLRTHSKSPAVFVVADEREESALTRALKDNGHKDTVIKRTEAGAFPYMLFCVEANGRVLKGYVLSDMFFREMPGLRADQVYEHISKWLRPAPAKRAIRKTG